MLFASGVVFAALLSSMAGPAPASSGWEEAAASYAHAARRAAPMPAAAVDLRLRLHEQQFDLKSLVPKNPPVEVKSLKVVGASGLAVYFPAADAVAAGVGVSAFKIQPQTRVMQFIFGLRFRF
ncbi:MAG TPA: hypothetical protein VIF57_32060 [Polyangia bacterium]|jgi:hypothetical protein